MTSVRSFAAGGVTRHELDDPDALLMIVVTVEMLAWTRRQGWW